MEDELSGDDFGRIPALRLEVAITQAKDFPRALCLVTHGYVELLMNGLVRAKCKEGDRIANDIGFTHSIKLTILHEMGVLKDDRFERLQWFRDIRNKFVHRPM